jgi:hypothetical protein
MTVRPLYEWDVKELQRARKPAGRFRRPLTFSRQ